MLQNYPYSKVPLDFPLDALNPYINSQTMELHYNRIYPNAVNRLNELMQAYPQFQEWSLEDLIIRDINQIPIVPAQRIKNSAGAVYNHGLFFEGLDPSHAMLPYGNLLTAIVDSYGSFADFQALFADAAKNIVGSGWVWLNSEGDHKVHISITGGNRCPAIDILTPILVLDVWEHAYMFQYPEEVMRYTENWFDVVDWEIAEARFNGCQKEI